jgi:hypothetical protein
MMTGETNRAQVVHAVIAIGVNVMHFQIVYVTLWAL